MAHFYGWLKNGRAESTRASVGKNNYTAIAQGKNGRITVNLSYNEATGDDHYEVLFQESTLHQGETVTHVIASGVLDSRKMPSKEMATMLALATVEHNYDCR